jgi:hypothetical protein
VSVSCSFSPLIWLATLPAHPTSAIYTKVWVELETLRT